MEKQAPKYALRFLRWFCREDYLEEIEGNLLEVFDMQYEDSEQKARRTFYWNVLLHFRPAFLRSFQFSNTLTHPDMIRHNFLIALRGFQRHRTSFLINLTSLSTGLACALMIYLWVSDELGVDKFHEHEGRLYQVMENQVQDNGILTQSNTPDLMAEIMKEELPEVEMATSVTPSSWFGNFSLKPGDGQQRVQASGQFAGKDFFRMFSYGLVKGNEKQVLSGLHDVVISEELAMKLFNTTEDVVGRSIQWQLLDFEKQAVVSGLFKNVPDHSSMQFDIVLSYEAWKALGEESGRNINWDNHGPETYVLLEEGTDLQYFNQKIEGYIKSKLESSNISLFATAYADRYLYGNYENGQTAGGRIDYVRLFSFIAIFILVIACINFMNLSTAKASRRMKELGVKKAVGASRGTLVFQYLGESLLMAMISLLTAVMLTVLLLPQFNTITGKELSMGISLPLVLGILAITILTGLLAGSYPALYLSGFNPVKVLRSKLNPSTGEVWTRKGLVVFQFVLSVILIVSVVVVYQQIEFIQSKNLGFEKDNIIHFEREGLVAEKQDAFLAALRQVPGIAGASAVNSLLMGSYSTTYGVHWEGKNPDASIQFEVLPSDYGLVETMNMEMAEGRSFSTEYGEEKEKIIFNEEAIQVMGLDKPIGKTVRMWGDEFEIIGVVRNFHFESLHEDVKPLLIRLDPEHTLKIVARLEAGREKEALAALEELYADFNPGFPLSFQFLDQDYQALYAAEQRVSTLAWYFAGIVILISCLGLFGLAAFTTERRRKEIGIRKILGSSEMGLISRLSSDFSSLVVVAIILALPVSYWLAQYWLSDFAFRVELHWWFFAGAGVLVLFIAWITVGLQTFRAARINPVDCLRSE